MAGAVFLLRADRDRDTQVDRAGTAGAAVDLGELVLGAGEADVEAIDFAEPAFSPGFGDAVEEVVADLGDAGRWPGRLPSFIPCNAIAAYYEFPETVRLSPERKT
jgi:hypothetical protein